MAKQLYYGFEFEKKLDQLAGALRVDVTRELLEAGAKVVAKEMQQAIQDNHHVLSGDMLESVAPTEVHMDVDVSSIEVYTQGTDSRGVKNEMKNVIISQGYYYRGVQNKRKPDQYLKGMRKRVEPRVQAVMSEQMRISLQKYGIID
jgi:hypothetical protein